ncbi:universal stress protein [bacterium]|nr:MAG: universal stress protein [bacterium]
MFTKILYPTDFSEKSRHALEVVKKLKEAGTKTVVVFHCIDIREVNTMAEMEGFSSLQYENIVDEIHEELKRKATKEMTGITKELRDLGFIVEERLPDGIPFREIIETAKKEKIDAIVIGSTGKGLLSEMLLGSTSEKVVREAECPVIVVK